jgi:phenylalanyl-tRNA synthetase beta chain
MKVSVNWLRKFTEIDLSVDELVEKIGAQLGAVEEIIDLGKKYQGIIIAKVVTCEKHPDADKLSVCFIDDGGKAKDIERNKQGLVQVVCGAPNVRTGITVAWLPPGSTVPSTVDKDPFVLGSRELRGVLSNGMLASAAELAISDDHNGIVEIDGDVEPGSDFADVYELNDFIIDIENKMFTHRPDCFGILGVAREVAGVQQNAFTSPKIYAAPKTTGVIQKSGSLPVAISVKTPDLVPRFVAQAFTNLQVAPSPIVMQTFLMRVGIRPINNIVDLTNYYMVLTGQPLHAYDYDKLMALSEDKKSVSLETRMSHKGDKITLLNGKELELQDDSTILITSNDVPVGIGGVMGGADTEVDENTTNIVIECANFDMYNIRRTSMKYGLFTDAVTRFNKGQSPLQNERVVAWLGDELIHLTGAMPDGTIHDYVSPDIVAAKKRDSLHGLIATEASFINQRLGSDLSADAIAELLRNVEFTVEVNNHVLHVTAPFWRTDIEIAEDIVEEVGRLYGYDRLPLELPGRSMSPVVPDEVLETKRQIRASLAAAGANEVLTYGFVHGDLMKKTGQDATKAFRLVNAISPYLQYFRFSLTPSLLEKIHGNIKAGYDELAIFEIGKTHSKTEVDEDKLPKEFDRLGLVLAKSPRTTSKQQASPYYQAKYYLEHLLGKSSEGLRYVPLEGADTFNHAMFEQMLAPFEPKRSALVFHGEKKLLGVVGEYKSGVKKILKLPDYTAGFELFLTPLVSLLDQTDVYTPLSRFPKTEQDITLKVSNKVSYQELKSLIQDILTSQENAVTSVIPISIFQKEGDESHQQITFRITVSSYVKTLKTEEVNTLLDSISSQAADKLQALRI